MRQMNYAEAVYYVENAVRFGGKKNGLDNIRRLLQLLGEPQNSYKCVHVAGTNGKGSVCASVDMALRCEGYRTGLYTSPYLERFNERMAVDGEYISDEDFARVASIVREHAERMSLEGNAPTFFELATACALYWFREMGVQYAVIEVGLGGRLDSTNVIDPLTCAITSIGLDHINVLGPTLRDIAYEKAGIIKKGVPVVLAQGLDRDIEEYIANIAEQRGAPCVRCSEYTINAVSDTLEGQSFNFEGAERGSISTHLLGKHQRRNVFCAYMLLQSLKARGVALSEEAVHEGLARAAWKGRFEVLDAKQIFIVDGAHNPQGAQALKESVEEYLPTGYITLVTAALKGKDYAAMARIFSLFASRVILTQMDDERRSLSAEQLRGAYEAIGMECECITDPIEAVRAARTGGGPVIAAGSLYLVGKLRTAWGKGLLS